MVDISELLVFMTKSDSWIGRPIHWGIIESSSFGPDNLTVLFLLP